MAASSSSNTPNVKQSSLSYAERARRAGASAAPPRAPALARNSGPNGKTRSGDESTSPASSSRNLTPNSSAALTLPSSSPPSSSQTSIDEPQTLPYIPKSPSKPTQPNVWATRKEQQMARAAVQQYGHASAPVQAENPSSQPSLVATNRLPTNGVNVSLQSNELMNVESDPFVVRMPAQGPGRERAAVSTVFRTPPSLDDSESWPEMGKGGPSVSTSVPSSIVDLDKKEGSSKKGEKTKWVQIPPAELQATHDAIAAQSQANSRAQSQQRRNNQAKSRSRQQSQARSTHSQNRNQSQNQNSMQGLSNGAGGVGLKHGDASTAHSRTESTTHSRTTSVHSSPRFPTRGRRLPEEHHPMPNLPSGANAGPSTSSKRPPNGLSEEPVLSPPENQNIIPTRPIYHDNNAAYMAPPQPLSGPHSQSHTPYSHSPVYYPPPPSSGSQGYGYGPMPPSGAYGGPPQPIPSPSMHQQGYMGYPPYGMPQHLPPGQPPFPYMYQPVPYPYYPSHMPVQQQETRPQQEEPQQDASEGATHLSPVLPPTSTLTRPPPPEESAALSGYRAISTVAVSPLLTASEPGQSISQITEPGGEVLFGSVGQPGGMKSPSPAPLLSTTGDVQDAKVLTAFAVGFDGTAPIRRKRTASAKDSADEVAEAVKVIDLTDKGSKWEFGTSAHPEVEGRSIKEESAYGANGQSQATRLHQELMESQILQPQPQHMLHYPPPNGPPTIQVGGYNMAPQVQMHMPSLPMPTQSPQGGGQPLSSHLPSLAPMPINPGFVSPLTLSSPAPGSGGPMSAMHVGDEWEVRDFGYGFGPTSGSGYMPERMREERFEREGYRDSRDNFREPRDFGSGGFGSGRMRRNSTAGGYGAGYYEGGRGGFAGRRGRGQNGFGRGFGRGGYGGRGGHGNFRHQPSLSVSTTFQHQQGMQQQHPQMSPEVPNGYYAPPSTATAQFMSSPYGQYNPGLPPPQSQPQPTPSQNLPQAQPSQQAQPPVPMPVTALSFPLDPLRLYLLGQLEYYFSIQNLASDLFLRKQMDSRGWLPIHLIASFNRVRQLTPDPQLVNEMLNLSSLVEVRGEYVRLSNAQWENFVLPSAAASTVEGEQVVRAQPAPAGAGDKETPDEEEEDDVVFVLGGEESRPWTGAS